MVNSKDISLSTSTCKNCGSDKNENYCPECGQKTYEKRFTLIAIFGVVLSTFDIDHGLLYTVKMLFIYPEKIIREYLDGRTKDYFNPVKYLIIVAGIGALLVLWFNIYDTNIENTTELLGQGDHSSPFQDKVNSLIKNYINIMSLLIVPFSALASKWYFKKDKLFYSEHLILVSFILAQSTIITIATYPIYIFAPNLINYFILIANSLTVIYFSYAFKRIFNISVFKAFFGGIIVQVGGMIMFILAFTTFAMLVILIMAKFGYPLKEMLGV